MTWIMMILRIYQEEQLLIKYYTLFHVKTRKIEP